ncbi:uncharacterized protein PV06_02368 [Exophiala oligosperma]|uniref:Uncharacterized protein n=1 Tax=Exophiala oligosperma TaxID=215243 RepID=A0A0D2CA40_9EURO|nr:uncharacterized protein PV06_02368 [Exophiala oligosperma]KIW46722.1 hypothetical protein PV06_02368 [Exophiala oligosperma]
MKKFHFTKTHPCLLPACLPILLGLDFYLTIHNTLLQLLGALFQLQFQQSTHYQPPSRSSSSAESSATVMSYLRLIPDEHKEANILISDTAQSTSKDRSSTPTSEGSSTSSSRLLNSTAAFLVLTPCIGKKHNATVGTQDAEVPQPKSDVKL